MRYQTRKLSPSRLRQASGGFRNDEFCAGEQTHFLKVLIKTTSLAEVPRLSATCFPSREIWKLKIRSDAKFVNCFGGEPSIGCAQRFVTPLRVTPYTTARPSVLHCLLVVSLVVYVKVLIGCPPSRGNIASLKAPFG